MHKSKELLYWAPVCNSLLSNGLELTSTMKIMLSLIHSTFIATVIAVALLVLSTGLLIFTVVDANGDLTRFESINLDDIKRVKIIAQQVTGNMEKESSQQNITLSERDLNLAISHFGRSVVNIPDAAFSKINLSQTHQSLQLTLPTNYLIARSKTEIEQRFNDWQGTLITLLSHMLEDQWINLEWNMTIDHEAERGL